MFSNLVIHTRALLGHVSKADAKLHELCKLMWCVLARCNSSLVQGPPEAISGFGIVLGELCRAAPCRRADEHNAQPLAQLIWKFFLCHR